MTSADCTLRPLGMPDAEAVASLFAVSRAAAMPWLPVLHTREETRDFFAHQLSALPSRGAFEMADLLGFAVVDDGWLHHLYVRPDRCREGIGGMLLRQASAIAGGSLQLWTFARNIGALHFYRAQGFREVERTDGSNNEEREPDIRLMRGDVSCEPLADGEGQ